MQHLRTQQNSLPQDILEARSLHVFKKGSDKFLQEHLLPTIWDATSVSGSLYADCLSEAGWISQGKITELIAQAFALPQTTFANHYQNGQNGLGGFMIYPGKAVLRLVCSTPFLPKKELQPDIVF